MSLSSILSVLISMVGGPTPPPEAPPLPDTDTEVSDQGRIIRCPILTCGENGTSETGLVRPSTVTLVTLTR